MKKKANKLVRSVQKVQTSSAHSYTILLRPEPEGGYTVIVPMLLGCVTYGRTIAEAQRMAEEAISLYIETLQESNEEVPSEKGSLLSSVTVA